MLFVHRFNLPLASSSSIVEVDYMVSYMFWSVTNGITHTITGTVILFFIFVTRRKFYYNECLFDICCFNIWQCVCFDCNSHMQQTMHMFMKCFSILWRLGFMYTFKVRMNSWGRIGYSGTRVVITSAFLILPFLQHSNDNCKICSCMKCYEFLPTSAFTMPILTHFEPL